MTSAQGRRGKRGKEGDRASEREEEGDMQMERREAATKRGKGVKQWEHVIREQRRETFKRRNVLEMVSGEGTSECWAARGYS